MSSKTAFLCTQCGDPVEARDEATYRLMMSRTSIIKCRRCARGDNGLRPSVPSGKPRRWRVWDKSRYQEYLKSVYWQQRRKRALQLADGRCQVCNRPACQVHHNCYDNLGHEPDRDLIATCRRCHKVITKLLGGPR